ncbi:CHRD domain-containing protein [Methyloversatilis sp. XJ19-49]|uniref:CHRD domain-containing protein n=1 Tax=Methyloversatilis sp. XJ19-49 TaxID=2963429 RepID=UPI00211BB86B|nr:CHRD domain-containing protein [Methyloversatilis sp. XJ19-49]MCQ9377864.1 CHRD domain-containing protein [Methyloversatilis sp. XJ19-49]
MNRIRLVAALLAATTLASPALAQEVEYFATLSGPAEAPPNESPGTGSVLLTLDLDLRMMTIDTRFSGLLGTLTVAHIHCCTALASEGTAGVATPTPTFPGFPAGVTSGSYMETFDMKLATSYNPAFITANGGTPDSAYTVLLAGLNDGKAYLNLHSSEFPGGEIRGFLAPVPEPETWAMLLGGLGLIGWAARGARRAAI